jgi:hypothetical protein
MIERVLSIPKDYHPAPGGRNKSDGPFNGERFRNEFLVPRLKDAIAGNEPLIVNFDDADSYSSSFLEEAFGGLVRTGVFATHEIKKYLILKNNDPVYTIFVNDAKEYIDSELKRRRR